MAAYLLDTNHISLAARYESVRRRLDRESKNGVRIGACVPVLCEIEGGIQSAPRPEMIRSAVKRVLRRVRLWPMNRVTTQLYGSIYRDLRRRGRMLSQVDIMVAALAVQMNVTVLTADRDFEALPEMKTENWTA